MMEENFGKVLFAKFVIDRATERPKGTAFVKFASEESAHKCIAESVLTGANSAKGRVSHKTQSFVNFSVMCLSIISFSIIQTLKSFILLSMDISADYGHPMKA